MNKLIEQLRKSKTPGFTGGLFDKAADALEQQALQIADLQRELDNERAREIHSCGPDCTRDGCVNRRLLAQLDQQIVANAALTGENSELFCKLVAAQKDAERWNSISALMFACALVELTQDEDGGYSISASEPVENYLPKSWSGDTPEAAIDAAMKEKSE